MMNGPFIALALLAGTALISGATVSDRLDRLEAEVSEMQHLLQELVNRRISPPSQPRQPRAANTPEMHYEIRKGDSYWSLARRHNLSISALERANPGVNPRRLSIGQKIAIPSRQNSPSSIQTTETGTYRVQPGDILGRISEAHGIRLAQLRDANPGLDPRRLQIGTVLRIPAQTQQATAPARPSSPSPLAEPASPDAPSQTERPSIAASSRANPFLANQPSAEPGVQTLAEEPGPVPTEEPRLITVQSDTRLSEIAQQYQTSVAQINTLNERNLSPRQMIKEGSQLYIPSR